MRERQERRLAQLSSCQLALNSMRLDLVRLRTGGSTVQGLTEIAAQAVALARDVDIAVQAASDVRALTTPRR
jgi:serine/threonine-protein kinase